MTIKCCLLLSAITIKISGMSLAYFSFVEKKISIDFIQLVGKSAIISGNKPEEITSIQTNKGKENFDLLAKTCATALLYR